MNLRCLGTVVLGVLLALTGSDLSANGSSGSAIPCEATEQGPVYLYGKLLVRPYHFSGIGSDTLRLNDLPFQPARRRAEIATKVRGSSEVKREVSQLLTLRARLDAEVAAVLSRTSESPSLEQRLDAMERIFRSAPEIEYVKRYDDGIDYKVRGIANEQAIMFGDADFGQQDSALEITAVEIHQRAIEGFWSTVCKGHLVAAGSGYRIIAPVGARDRLMIAIETVRTGKLLSEDQAREWPFLAETPFARDLQDSSKPGQ